MVGGCISKVVTTLDRHKGFYQAIYQKNARIFLYQLVYGGINYFTKMANLNLIFSLIFFEHRYLT